LQQLIGKIRAGLGIDSIISLRSSTKFTRHMAAIEEAQATAPSLTESLGRLEEDHDYKIIVDSNKIIHEINEEFENIHRLGYSF